MTDVRDERNWFSALMTLWAGLNIVTLDIVLMVHHFSFPSSCSWCNERCSQVVVRELDIGDKMTCEQFYSFPFLPSMVGFIMGSQLRLPL